MRRKLHDAVRRAPELIQGTRQATLVPSPEYLGGCDRSVHSSIIAHESTAMQDDAPSNSDSDSRQAQPGDRHRPGRAASLSVLFPAKRASATRHPAYRVPRLPVSPGQATRDTHRRRQARYGIETHISATMSLECQSVTRLCGRGRAGWPFLSPCRGRRPGRRRGLSRCRRRSRRRPPAACPAARPRPGSRCPWSPRTRPAPGRSRPRFWFGVIPSRRMRFRWPS
jgi:hypothetical protein